MTPKPRVLWRGVSVWTRVFSYVIDWLIILWWHTSQIKLSATRSAFQYYGWLSSTKKYDPPPLPVNTKRKLEWLTGPPAQKGHYSSKGRDFWEKTPTFYLLNKECSGQPPPRFRRPSCLTFFVLIEMCDVQTGVILQDRPPGRPALRCHHTRLLCADLAPHPAGTASGRRTMIVDWQTSDCRLTDIRF